MDYFSYPLDVKSLIRKKDAIRKELLLKEFDWIEKRVAILGGSTTNEVVEQLELALLHHGIKVKFYQSEYGQYYEDAVFGNEELDNFQPDIIYIHTNWRNIQVFPDITSTVDDADILLHKEYKRYESMWITLKKKFGCPIIQNNFDRPDYRLLGNRDIWDWRGRSNFISRLNQKFYEFVKEEESFYINDIDYLSAEFGLSEWNNPTYWNLYKYACPVNAIPYLAQSVANIIKSLYGKNKKVLALDLDNTLWGGVIGDDGIEGIKIGTEIPGGQSYHAFQSYVKELQQIGIVLAVNSKNDESNALAGLAHPDGVLKSTDFVSIKANWNTKDMNLHEIADELSLGLDSFVFVDDSSVERELVKSQLPMVEVPQMDSVERYIKVLENGGYFEATMLLNEDLNKTETYRARTNVMSVKEQYADYGEYLKSLEMKAVVTEFEPMVVKRIAQLTNKSNQFNLTTLRCSERDIQDMQKSPAYICLCGRLIDKFVDNGIVTVIAGEIKGDELHIRIWLMSCRVLKRGLEDFMMNVLVEKAKENRVKKLVAYYYPTAKNRMVKTFYTDYDFQQINVDEKGNITFELDIDEYNPKITQIIFA